jgi:IS5 family transposase
MRQERTVQANIFDVFAGHEIGRELKAMSQWLDEHRALLGLVAADLRRDGVRETGRQGLPAEAVLRCGLLKQYRQLSYEELAFHLEDSASFRAFARLPWSWSPKKSVLQKTISIIKGSRDVDYGHKLNLTTGKSGLMLDLVIEAGNPADRERLLPMLKRHIALYGKAPRQAAADGGFASRDNLAQAKACGVRDMAFHKKSGLKIEDMVKSHWIYRKLRNFRAGIEAGISCLKRAYGLARCTWRGLDHFKAYVWSSVVAYNLALLARLRPA